MNVLLLIGSYVLGSIPFGVIVARSKGVDIMSVGSGNIGATNVYRAVGAQAAWTVFALDVLKGLIPAYAATYLLKSADWGMYAGIAAVLGHVFSPFLKFKGGKGIATTLGVLIGVAPVVAAAALVVFVLIVVATRYVSLGAIIAAIVAAIGCFVDGETLPVSVIFSLLAVVILLKHIPNIKRLLAGTERKFLLKPTTLETADTPVEQSAVAETPDAAVAKKSKGSAGLT